MNNTEACLIIAGEKSGEDHAMSFFLKLKEKLPEIEYFGVGGDQLAASGVDLIYHIKDFSAWGLTEVLLQIPFFIKAMKRIENEVEKRNCKVAILVDFQTFNLSLAKRLKKKGIKVLYYVAPQAWAWKEWRTKVLEKTVHTLFAILPFEKKWFEDRGVTRVKAVKHPLAYEIKDKLSGNQKKKFSELNSSPLKITILPGSRNNEVRRLLPIMVEAVKRLKNERDIVVSLVRTSSVKELHYRCSECIVDRYYDSDDIDKVLNDTDFALAASGTVTLRAAIWGIPTVMCYQASLLTEIIMRLITSYDGYYTLPNIIHEEKVLPELIQRDVTAQNILSYLHKWTSDEETYDYIIAKLSETLSKLSGEEMDVSSYMANVIMESYA